MSDGPAEHIIVGDNNLPTEPDSVYRTWIWKDLFDRQAQGLKMALDLLDVIGEHSADPQLAGVARLVADSARTLAGAEGSR